MLKLKKVICQLNEDDLQSIDSDFVKAKADKFRVLFKEYRSDKHSDDEIMEMLGINKNAFYVLKSRLNDKIRDFLTGGKEIDKFEILKQLSKINALCYETPRETAISVLLKLEKDLKAYDLSADLTVVYSTLKKLHVNSPKYYFYSQLYNKHVAYFIALEKADDLLGEFARNLSLYFFSRAKSQKELLILLRKELRLIYALNKAQHVEFICNLVTIQLSIFCDIVFPEDEALEDLFLNSEKIIESFPGDSHYQHYRMLMDFLQFEYYLKINQLKKAGKYFENVNAACSSLLLFSNCCIAYKFLLSKIEYYSRLGITEKLEEENAGLEWMYDKDDTHTQIILDLYLGVSLCYAGKCKKAISTLNQALNLLSTKDCLHMEMELKLCLAYFYYLEKEYEQAANILRSVYRKLNSLGTDEYENAMMFHKLLNVLMDGKDGGNGKISKTLRLFGLHNTGEKKILSFIEPEINKLKAKYIPE
jgi:hypothetical protein